MTDTSGPIAPAPARQPVAAGADEVCGIGGVDEAARIDEAAGIDGAFDPRSAPVAAEPAASSPPGPRSPALGILSVGAAAAMIVGTWCTLAIEPDAADVLLRLGIAVNLFSLLAVVLGILAIVLRRGHRPGIAGAVLGVLLNPALLAATLPLIGGR